MYSVYRKLLIVFTVFISVQCANPGSPTGGPKDEMPPVILSSTPENGQTNFDSKKIEIKFDELVKFKDLKKQLVISPPMEYDPIIKPTGNAMDKVKIKIVDTLAENTTYTINFGESLQDNNEGNVYSNFRYVFSTGDYIDSLSLEGKISDAFDDKFAENIMVMLYEIDSSFNDSTIFKEIPTYVTNTIKSDTFRIDNARAGTYLLVALEENRRDLIFDPNTDKLAFYPEYITLPDSNKYLLKLFKQTPDFNIKRPVHSGKGEITFKFDGYPTDIQIERLFPEKSDTVLEILNFSEFRDSASYWLSARETDSIQFLISSKEMEVVDTVVVTLKKQKKVDTEFVLKKEEMTPQKRVSIHSNYPILSFVTDSISIMNITDSIDVNFETSIEDLHELKLDFEPEYSKRYYVKVLPGAIENIFGENNDSIFSVIAVKKKSDYGEIVFKIKNISSFPVFVDLLTEKDAKIIERIYAREQQDFIFSSLNPGKYKIRLIYDENSNERWDPGSYLKKQMPEEVKYFPEVMDIKANWDVEQEWVLHIDE